MRLRRLSLVNSGHSTRDGADGRRSNRSRRRDPQHPARFGISLSRFRCAATCRPSQGNGTGGCGARRRLRGAQRPAEPLAHGLTRSRARVGGRRHSPSRPRRHSDSARALADARHRRFRSRPTPAIALAFLGPFARRPLPGAACGIHRFPRSHVAEIRWNAATAGRRAPCRPVSAAWPWIQDQSRCKSVTGAPTVRVGRSGRQFGLPRPVDSLRWRALKREASTSPLVPPARAHPNGVRLAAHAARSTPLRRENRGMLMETRVPCFYRQTAAIELVPP